MNSILHQWQPFWRKNRECFFRLGLTLMVCLLISFIQPLVAQETDLEKSLPTLKHHTLPPTLIQWQDVHGVGDYFDQISASPAGYLIWSKFPIKVYLDRPQNLTDNSASNLRFQQWVEGVTQGIKEWQVYLPIVEVPDPKLADILIKRTDPPLDTTFDQETGKLKIPRARSAQTRYDFYFTEDHPPLLFHRMTIKISPRLSQSSILSATRHELGHGLGIWGHSDQETDALYFSQVRHPPTISVRDINTLKKIYQQPTRLGWPLPESVSLKLN
ncbi:MAG TPA: peptidase [Cyanothece sp. UBA12306]|nr:peptidase [Cyanothece sp. UBA12306]